MRDLADSFSLFFDILPGLSLPRVRNEFSMKFLPNFFVQMTNYAPDIGAIQAAISEAFQRGFVLGPRKVLSIDVRF